MRTLRYVVVDVFTDRPLAGNQLAVFTDARNLSESAMRALAREMNFSESVFVLPPERGGNARIRIFTPTVELPFAGHPVLGTAFVLGAPLQREIVSLETGAGNVSVALEREGPRIVFGWMVQPVPNVTAVEDPTPLLAALRVPGSVLPIELYDLGPQHVFIALPSRDAVAAVRPDMGALASAADAGVNVFSGEGDRYKARVFAPAHGVAEDPATGSAAGPLAVHLLRHGRIASGQTIVIEQGAEIGRPSELHARAYGTKERIERVEVGGAAVVVAHGEFRLRQLT